MTQDDRTAIIGQRAYEAYGRESDGKSLVSGAPLPSWADLPAAIQRAWGAAAAAVLDETCWDCGRPPCSAHCEGE